MNPVRLTIERAGFGGIFLHGDRADMARVIEIGRNMDVLIVEPREWDAIKARAFEGRAEAWALDNHGAYLGVPMPHIEGWQDEDGAAYRRFPTPDDDCAILDGWVEPRAIEGSHGVVWTWSYYLERDCGTGMRRVGRPDTAPSLMAAVRLVEQAASEYRQREADEPGCTYPECACPPHECLAGRETT